MLTFWDTSAVLPLVLKEPWTPLAESIFQTTTIGYAWEWLRVEAEAGLNRRGASESVRKDLARLLDWFQWIKLSSADHGKLCVRNRSWRLRAADAGHLYCFEQVAVVLPEVQFACFDLEIRQAGAASGARFVETGPAAGH